MRNIELHKRLQEFYKEKMGEWKIGDKVYHYQPETGKQKSYGLGILVAMPQTLLDIQFRDNGRVFHHQDYNLLRIPTLEELWGMTNIKGINYIIDNYNFEQLLHSRGIYKVFLEALIQQEGL